VVADGVGDGDALIVDGLGVLVVFCWAETLAVELQPARTSAASVTGTSDFFMYSPKFAAPAVRVAARMT
jgi:hypothetical protein